jgi:hypothetical protein
MIRLKFHHRTRVSNRLAILGALLLGLTAFSGFNDTKLEQDMLPELAGSGTAQAASEAADAAERPRRSSISRLLFGFGR